MRIYLFIFISLFTLFSLSNATFAQTTPPPNTSTDYSLFTGPTTLPTITNVSKSNALQIQVGNPAAPAPTDPPITEGPVCSAPPQVSPSPSTSTSVINSQASCPIPDGKIGCASYGPVREWTGFHGACAADSSGNGGHCNAIYQGQVGICLNRESGGNLIRTAKSIDVSANSKPDDPVYLPTIKGQTLSWFYKGERSAGGDFGGMRLFQSEQTPEGVYSIHFIHVNLSTPSLQINQEIKSGEVGATIFPLDGWPHAHISVGLNVGDSVDDLKDYSPGWLAPDRDLNMCTGIEKPVAEVDTIKEGLSFPLKDWTGGVKLHWGKDKGGTDFPSDKPQNPDQWIGTEVLAIEDGTIEEVNNPGYRGPGGNYIQIVNTAGTLRYYYAHLKEKKVARGEKVKAGQVIGTLGGTCFAEELCNIPYAHLHLGIGPEISYGTGPAGGVGKYDAVGYLCKILGKKTNEKGECP